MLSSEKVYRNVKRIGFFKRVKVMHLPSGRLEVPLL